MSIYSKLRAEKEIFLPVLLSLWLFLSGCSASRPAASSSRRQSHKEAALYKATQAWIGTPYRYGGSVRTGTDCSGFTMAIYQEVYQIRLVHNSREQWAQNCHKEISPKRLKAGDLVFFVTDGRRACKRNINHVGIYLDGGRFIHASTKRGVIISNLNESYYHKNWVTGGRVK